MKRFFLVVSFFVGFVFAIVLLGFTLRVRAGTGPASGNGDVNGDAVIDISDAVYLLGYLFQNGEPPVAVADSPALVGRVAALEADTAAIAETLAEFRNPCRDRPDRFIDDGDGTLTDTCTGLMWEQVASNFGNYQLAIDHVEGLQLAGHYDWRLPTIHELAGIVKEGWDPPADPLFAVSDGLVWSSSPYASSAEYGWVATFTNDTDYDSRGRQRFVQRATAGAGGAGRQKPRV